MSGGRPTKLTPELKESAQSYLSDCPHAVPSAAGLARHLNVSKSSIYKWGDEDAQFSHTLEDIQSEQEQRLIDNGLTGVFNSTIAKLMLHNHGHSDKVDSTLSGPDGGPVQTQSFEFVPVGNDSKD